jgi:hypothetical protein
VVQLQNNLQPRLGSDRCLGKLGGLGQRIRSLFLHEVPVPPGGRYRFEMTGGTGSPLKVRNLTSPREARGLSVLLGGKSSSKHRSSGMVMWLTTKVVHDYARHALNRKLPKFNQQRCPENCSLESEIRSELSLDE